MTTAAIVSVGNELLYGETVDTNAAWLGRTLTPLGVRVVRRFTVGDVDADIREAVRRSMDAADMVVVSGGLGPTPDDRTAAALGELFGQRLVEAEVLPNRWGTAPGLLVREEGRTVVLLPGVPPELEGIVSNVLLPRLETLGLTSDAAHHFVVHTTGCPEPRLAEAVEARRREAPPDVLDGVDVAYLPDLTGVDLRFTIHEQDPERARERFEAVAGVLGPAWTSWAFDAPSGDLAEAVLTALRSRGTTVAVAESCTGGLVGARLTDHAGSSDVVLGGVIAYADEVKIRDLGVPASLLERHGAVSEPVVRAMAEGVATHFRAGAAIALTGVAGPGGGSAEKPVGTVWSATYLDGVVHASLGRFTGDRGAVRKRAAQAALYDLYRRLTSR